MEIPQEKSPWMEVPLHTLMKLTPKAYGTEVEKFKADIPAVSTWRPKGSTAKHHDSVSEGMPEVVVGEVDGTSTKLKEDTVPKVVMTGLPLP
jgi:hypothetical protein